MAANNLSHVITVIHGKIEDIDLPEKVDLIISEPMGVLLVHERMIESFLLARDRFLKPKVAALCPPSCMFPSRSCIYLSPFTDSQGFIDMMGKARFWEQSDFFGVNLDSLRETSILHYFTQPVVGNFDAKTLMSPGPLSHALDFTRMSLDALYEIEIPLDFELCYTGLVHGLAGWFDVDFMGSSVIMKLTTSPAMDQTHWHQIRFFLPQPIAVNAGDRLVGSMKMRVNGKRSYDIDLHLALASNPTLIHRNYAYALHEQQYNYSTATYPDTSAFRPEYVNLYGKEQ